jgi:hypothetical protein
MPEKPRRFRVTDATADFGFACVGGGACPGGQLPAILAGSPYRPGQLASTALLGKMRLDDQQELDDGVSRHVGVIRVEVAATAGERKNWEPWLAALISEMVPLATRVELHWVASQALRTGRLDGTLTLEPDPAARLGTDAITGLSRLPECGASISASGPQIGLRLC